MPLRILLPDFTTVEDFCRCENTTNFKRQRFKDEVKMMPLSSPGNYMTFNEIPQHAK